MKKILLISFLWLSVLSLSACGGGDDEPLNLETPEQTDGNSNNGNNTENNTAMKIHITVVDREITATMEDNAAAREFISRLPLEITLNDYNNTTEKIFYPDPALKTEGVKRGCAPIPGDITIYAPWGNVAIFCKNWSYSNDLIKIGHIDGDGISALTVSGDVKVKIERQ